MNRADYGALALLGGLALAVAATMLLRLLGA